MSKSYTIPELAKSIGCSGSLMRKLIVSGKIASERNGPKGHHKIKLPKYEVERIINEHTKGRYGFKKNDKVAAKPVVKKNTGLKAFTDWIALNQLQRELLIKLSEKYDVNELELLLNL